jgi:hypothetical protein
MLSLMTDCLAAWLTDLQNKHSVSLHVSDIWDSCMVSCRNASLGLAQCAKESWQLIEKGSWTGVMSPFETRFLDIRTLVSQSHSVVSLDISVQEGMSALHTIFQTALWLL